MSRIRHAIEALYSRDLARPEPGKIHLPTVVARSVFCVSVLVFYGYQIPSWYNMDMKELNNITEKKVNVGNEFQRRNDLIANLDYVVEHYAKHERVLFEHVSDMRSKLQSLESGAPGASSGEIEQALIQLTALAEQYPDLKAEKRFHDLMDMAETTENRIADSLDEYIEMIIEFDLCNQRFWCNYFTYPLASFVPLPAYWEYYHITGDFVSPSVETTFQTRRL